MSAKLVVQKYGGMSLATADHIRAAASRVAKLRSQGTNVVAVVSAMGKSTDALIAQAYSVSPAPNRRELDMLLSTGERVSMALFSMALTDALKSSGTSAKAISFTGSQAGILTDETHSNARIVDIRAHRVEEALANGDVVILAGFQGVSPLTKEITTLGRGGTDVTAVALAAALGADRCEILKEVPGVMSADPSIVKNARQLSELTHRQLLEMTFWGAKVLHYRSVELAATHTVPLFVGLAHGNDRTSFTSISGGLDMNKTFEQDAILGVNSHADVREILIRASSIGQALKQLQTAFDKHQLPPGHILDVTAQKEMSRILVTGPSEVLEAQVKTLAGHKEIAISSGTLATVSITCQGTYSTNLIDRMVGKLETANIPVQQIIASPLGFTFVINATQCANAVQILHSR